jgi:hypothetical protein
MKTYRKILEINTASWPDFASKKQQMSDNEHRGFHGVAYNRLNMDMTGTARAFARYATILSKYFKASENSMRVFLDSIAGRHFADQLSDDELAGKKKPKLAGKRDLMKDMRIHLNKG